MTEAARVAYVFPGQGAQAVGMGRDLYEAFPAARAVFDEADAALGFALSALCFEGPAEELTRTINAQPALLTTSYACLAAARETGALPAADFVAGHSLGEYTALAAAGALSFGDAVRLARERGRLMHEAGLLQPGTMAAILGLDEGVLAEICRETGTVIANFNCPGQLVISGGVDSVARAVELAAARGASRTVTLQVSGAFHSPLMQPAVEGMKAALAAVAFRDAAVPVIANVTARPVTQADDIRRELLDQLTSPVRWQRSMEYAIARGVTRIIEIGPGRVLTGLMRRIDRSVETANIGDAAAISGLAK